MDENKEKDQKICLKFCASNDIPCSNAFLMLQKTFGDSVLSEDKAYELYTTYKNDVGKSHNGTESEEMTVKVIEQRVCLKFCVTNKIYCAEALNMLRRVYGESSISKTRAYEWYKAFKDGREEVENLPRSGRPSTANTQENVENVRKIVLANPSVSIRDMAETLGVSFGSVQHIVVDILCMKRVADSWHAQ